MLNKSKEGEFMIISILAILILIFIDQASKFYVVKNFVEGESLPIIGNFFHFTYVKNRGVAFGVLQNKLFLITFVGVAAVGIIGYYVFQSVKKEEWVARIAYIFIMSGAIGNILDRIYRGYVVDFIDFRGIWTFVFNIADVWINVGVVFLLIQYAIEDKKREEK